MGRRLTNRVTGEVAHATGMFDPVINDEAPNPITSFDLFCGAGGLTTGLSEAKVDCLLAADNWIAAKDTFAANFPGVPFALGDLGAVPAERLIEIAGARPTLVSGGPPCQGFSSAGRRAPGDPRNSLVTVFAKLVVDLRPRLFLFENVEGFLTAEDGARVLTSSTR